MKLTDVTIARTSLAIITFRVRRSRGQMYIVHGRLSVCLSVCLSVPRRIPKLLHGPGCNLGNGSGASTCGLLGGFAIGARVSLLWQHSAEREMSASDCTCSVPGYVLLVIIVVAVIISTGFLHIAKQTIRNDTEFFWRPTHSCCEATCLIKLDFVDLSPSLTHPFLRLPHRLTPLIHHSHHPQRPHSFTPGLKRTSQQLCWQNFCSRRTPPAELSSSPTTHPDVTYGLLRRQLKRHLFGKHEHYGALW